MIIGPINFDEEHSLIQKAVRRGNVTLVEKVGNYLIKKGNKDWLKRRLPVMVYEECWTFGDKLIDKKKYLEYYIELTKTVKNKNAAGLAAFAKKVAGGGYEITTPGPEKSAIAKVAEAIRDPYVFWKWVENQPGYKVHKTRIDMAKTACKKVSFRDDQAMIYAAAYLAVMDQVSDTRVVGPNNGSKFPYWTAIDKHTDVGRFRIDTICDQLKYSSADGQKLVFLLAGSVCNQITDSNYWDEYVKFELKKIGGSVADAENEFEKIKDELIKATQKDVKSLKRRIDGKTNSIDGEQPTLF